MKKAITIFLIAAIMITTAGCSGDNTVTESSGGSSKVESSTVESQESVTEESKPVVNGEVTLEVLDNYPVTSEEFFEYDIRSVTYKEDGGIRITKYTGTDPIVVVPDTIDGHPVTEVGGYIFANDSFVTTVKLPKFIKRLSKSFINNSEIKIIDARFVEEIEESAIGFNPELEQLILGDALLKTAGGAIGMCSKLKEVYISANFSEIPDVYNGLDEFVGMPDDFTIVGEEGSYIEQWAKDNGINFRVK